MPYALIRYYFLWGIYYMRESFEHVLLHLSLIDGVGSATIKTIIERKPDNVAWHALYDFLVIDWMSVFGCQEPLAVVLTAGLKNKNLLEQELRLIDQHAIQWITVLSDEYPSLLKHIHNPPVILYWQGNLDCLTAFTFAIVGSRKANFYAQDAINTFVPSLVVQGWTVVSGGALGADSMAHQATLNAGGKTAAVLGSGLLHKYPASNKKLFAQMIDQGGAVVSSFSVDTPAYPVNFPIRNRIVSGLSKGCLIVQAAQKSGARITAQYALDQGRDVFAIPGSIKDPLSKGCHDLIQLGAKLVTSADDIIVEYAAFSIPTRHYVQQTLLDTQQEMAYDSPATQIIAACAQARSVEELLTQTNYSLAELQTMLFELQLDGKIKQDFAGMWQSSC